MEVACKVADCVAPFGITLLNVAKPGPLVVVEVVPLSVRLRAADHNINRDADAEVATLLPYVSCNCTVMVEMGLPACVAVGR